MEDTYVVSVGARERLLAAAEPREDHYVVRAGLRPALVDAAAPHDLPIRHDHAVARSASGRD